MREADIAGFLLRTVSAIIVGSLLGLDFPLAAGAQALPENPEIVITKNTVDKIKLLLEEFRAGSGATREDVSQVQSVVVQDLDFSGIFGVSTLPSVTKADSLSFGASYRALVRGTVVMEGGNLVLKGRLESLPDGGLIFDRDYRTRAEWYREAAHRFADDIVLYLFGENGISRTRIVFSLLGTGRKELYAVDYDGFGLRPLTDLGSLTLSPTWSPDLSKVAYSVFSQGSYDIHLLDLAGGKSTPLVTGPGVQSAPAWSPVGDHLAFSETVDGGSGIYVCRASDGSGRRRVTHDIGIDTSPAWSPDGRMIAFVSDRSGNPQIYITDADGGGTRRLTFGGTWNDQPSWSPDGENIAYAGRDKGGFRIFLTDPGGQGSPRQITFGPGSDESPGWAPDSRHLVFTSSRGGDAGIYIVNTQNSIIRALVVGKGDCSTPEWSAVPPR